MPIVSRMSGMHSNAIDCQSHEGRQCQQSAAERTESLCGSVSALALHFCLEVSDLAAPKRRSRQEKLRQEEQERREMEEEIG